MKQITNVSLLTTKYCPFMHTWDRDIPVKCTTSYFFYKLQHHYG